MSFNGIKAMVCAALVGAAASAASAATITDGSLLPSGRMLDLSGATACAATGSLSTNVGTFQSSGKAGSGAASCGDTTTAQVKKPATPHPYGRFDPDGIGWVDSNDLPEMVWTVDIGRKIRGLSFRLTDAHDQEDSFFKIKLGCDCATWEIAEREDNGSSHLIKILFDTPKDRAEVKFLTRHNDGYGLSQITVAPVPVPAGLVLAGTGVAALAAAGRRRRKSRSDADRKAD